MTNDAGAVPPELAGATARINLGALADNWRSIRDRVAPAECGATIKADGYGLGITRVAKALWEAGCKTFFVALPKEGEAVRDAVPAATIYILSGLLPGQAGFYIRHKLRPTLVTPEEISEWAGATNGACAAAVHVDTGINRLGLSFAQAEELARDEALQARAGLCLVMSHLHSGDDAANPSNAAQAERFAKVRGLFPALPGSLANSPGCYLGAAFAHDLARPGVALYGGNPLDGKPSPVKPVVSVTAPVLQVRHIEAGESVGYSASWVADRPSRIAIVAAGYADGISRHMSWPAHDGPADVVIGARRAPIVGRVSMDMLTIDVTDIAEADVQRGSEVELLGHTITVDDWARWAGTIPYEILTSLGRRYARVYSS